MSGGRVCACPEKAKPISEHRSEAALAQLRYRRPHYREATPDRLVLQQAWQITTYIDDRIAGIATEWRDVPIDEAAGR